MSNEISKAAPPIKGLVLAGGESTRMGVDKGLIEYHGTPQREYLAELLKLFTSETFISCRPGQIVGGNYQVLEDTYSDLGPFGGILSAFTFNSSCAWLVVACDFPLLDSQAIEQLVSGRDPSSIATSFMDSHSQLPEPWITILEPRIYPLLLGYLQRGRSSLRGVLEDYGSHTLIPENEEILLNANTPEEVLQIRNLLNRQV